MFFSFLPPPFRQTNEMGGNKRLELDARNLKLSAASRTRELLASRFCIRCSRLAADGAFKMHFCAHSNWRVLGLRGRVGVLVQVCGLLRGRRLFSEVAAAKPAFNCLRLDEFRAERAFLFLRLLRRPDFAQFGRQRGQNPVNIFAVLPKCQIAAGKKAAAVHESSSRNACFRG